MPLLDLLLNQRKVGTPGINPAAPDIRPDAPASKLDDFLGKPGGNFLMNLLAQEGFSTTPQSPLGAVGRASVATQAQQRQGLQDQQKQELAEVQKRLLEAQIGLTDAKAGNPNALNPTASNVQSVFTDKDGFVNTIRRDGSIQKTEFQEGVNARVVDGPAGSRFIVDGRTGERIGDLVGRDEAIQTASDAKEAVAGAQVRGETEEKRAQNLPKTVQAADQTIRGIDNVIGETRRALDLVGPSSTGAVGGLLEHIPGTDAFSLGKIRKTIKSNIGFDKLAEMRRVSPSGASGLGQLSTIELDGLQNGLTNLDQAQSEGDVKRALVKVLQHYETWRGLIEQHKFDEQRRVGETDVLPPGFSEAE